MQLTFRFSGIAKMLGGLTAGTLAVATFGQPAFANVIYDLAANPPAVTVMQGQGGTDTISVTLSMQSNEKASVQFPTNTTIVWQYLSGDKMDAVTGANVTGGSCYVFNNAGAVIASNVLNPGGSCSIVETFTTGDPRNPDPDQDSGTWAVQSALAVKGLTSGMTVAQKVSFQAIVTDPTKAPEPGTMALFGLGLIGIGTLGRQLKRSDQSEINL
ncbi:MAG TPA: PEP-CTERM sorting domain-containing protein [Bryobacteraceae bacterium]|nr:PEP-CTERM sorting domain-containing protein [Bryobacteraceae bacterium]